MNKASIDHFLSCMPKAENAIVVDLSLPENKNTALYDGFSKVVEGYDSSLDSKADVVLFVGAVEALESFDDLSTKAKKLLSENGICLFGFTSESIDSWTALTSLRAKDFHISEFSSDKLGELKDHVFIFKHAEIKENPVIQFTPQVPCSQSSDRCNVPNNQSLPECCTEHLYTMIDFLANICTEHGITYWLDGGTLLGAARDGKIIPWDKNANFAILEKDLLKLKGLYKYFTIEGYYLEGKRRSIVLNYSRKNSLYVKIYCYRTNTTNMVLDDIAFDKSHIDTLSEVELNGKKYKCPSNLETFLLKQYGANWKIPSNSCGKVSF